MRRLILIAGLVASGGAAAQTYVDAEALAERAATDAALLAIDPAAPCALGGADVLLIEPGAEPTRVDGPATLIAADGARLDIQAGATLITGGPIRAGGTAADCSAAMAALVQWAQSRIGGTPAP
jgi:hypothetical protein